jgi:hypothetical protein
MEASAFLLQSAPAEHSRAFIDRPKGNQKSVAMVEPRPPAPELYPEFTRKEPAGRDRTFVRKDLD